MFETITTAQLTTVTGGFTEAELRSWAETNAPHCYARLKHKPMSKITRADAERCVNEANPDWLTRSLIRHQLDSYFNK
jgi:hypothetical protein